MSSPPPDVPNELRRRVRRHGLNVLAIFGGVLAGCAVAIACKIYRVGSLPGWLGMPMALGGVLGATWLGNRSAYNNLRCPGCEAFIGSQVYFHPRGAQCPACGIALFSGNRNLTRAMVMAGIGLVLWLIGRHHF